jgi:hypothetical protein
VRVLGNGTGIAFCPPVGNRRAVAASLLSGEEFPNYLGSVHIEGDP